MSACLVTGTDTGAGKSVLAAAMVASLAATGERVRAHKPVVTGLDDPAAQWPPDHVLLGEMAGMAPEDVSPVRFGPAVSPHLAAEMAGVTLRGEDLLAGARRALEAAAPGPLVIEGVGGLLVPLADDLLVADLAAELRVPLVVAARPGLGTINHTLLTVQAARARALHVHAVVLTPWPGEASAMERSNRETIARLADVPVHLLPFIEAPRRELLAAAGSRLPLEQWL